MTLASPSVVSEQLSAQYGAVKMLHSRVRLVLDFLKAVQSGKWVISWQVLYTTCFQCCRWTSLPPSNPERSFCSLQPTPSAGQSTLQQGFSECECNSYYTRPADQMLWNCLFPANQWSVVSVLFSCHYQRNSHSQWSKPQLGWWSMNRNMFLTCSLSPRSIQCLIDMG